MRRLLATLLAIAAPLTAATPALGYGEDDLARTLAVQMRHAGSASGAYVADLDSGRTLYAKRADTARIPASVEKLYTTSTALLRFGAGTRLRTTAAMAPGAVIDADGTLHGDLALVGGGDPFFGDDAAAILARSVRSAGVRRIDGAVVGDESAFDGLRSACCTSYDADLGGVLSALAYDRGIFRGRARLDAARFAAGRFAAELRAAGVTVSRHSRAGTAPAGSRTLAIAPSRPFSELARFTNVPSNNFAAEMLLKDLGARYGDRGSEAAGIAVVRDTLDDFGLRPVRIADGSGLSRRNASTPRQVVTLLQRMAKPDVAATFRASLAVAGLTGTVRKRMRGTPAAGRCQLKTGTLRLVSALAGYCQTAGGRDVVFALLSNGVNTFNAKAREDRMAAAVARLDEGPAPVLPGPTTTVPATPPAGGALPPAR
jgi:D-alanyl-D-alanine carboxypeptidase/D-alanyl-D-alanine-endopeptidase (penicillin-binding protein 4)